MGQTAKKFGLLMFILSLFMRSHSSNNYLWSLKRGRFAAKVGWYLLDFILYGTDIAYGNQQTLDMHQTLE